MKAAKRRKRNGRIPEYNPDPKDDKILWANMDRLMNKYPGQYVIVAGGEIFVGRDVAKIQREADRKYPDITAVGCPIPRKKDLFCILFRGRKHNLMNTRNLSHASSVFRLRDRLTASQFTAAYAGQSIYC